MKSMGDLLKRAIGQSEKLPPKYWTEGWNKFSFLMTPEQVKEVFDQVEIVNLKELPGEFGFVTPVMMEGDYETRSKLYKEQIVHMIRIQD